MVVGQLRRPSAYVHVPFPTRADTPVRPYNTSTHPGNIPHINVGADRCPKIRNRSFVAPKPRYGCPQAGISAPTNGHMDAYAGTIHQCRASAPCCFSGICRTGSYVRHRKFYNRHRKNYVRPRKFYVRHRKRAVSTPPGRTVKPFHNDNRCVARSDTCGIHPPTKADDPEGGRTVPNPVSDTRSTSSRSFPLSSHFRRWRILHHTAVSVCWTASPSICIRASRSPHRADTPVRPYNA